MLGLGPGLVYFAAEFGHRYECVAACADGDHSFQAGVVANFPIQAMSNAAPQDCGAVLSHSDPTLALSDQRILVLQLLKCCEHDSHLLLEGLQLSDLSFKATNFRRLPLCLISEMLRLSCGFRVPLKGRAIPFRQISAYFISGIHKRTDCRLRRS